MDGENIFWLNIWRTVGAVVTVGILTFSGCDTYRTKTIAKMVEGGANPIAARCAIDGMAVTEALCLDAARQ